MSNIPQTQAIEVANNLASLAQQLYNLNLQIQAINSQWGNNGTSAILAAMKTAALNADGSISATDDATPTSGHPISPNSYPALGRSLAASQYVQILNVLNNIPVYLSGSAVNATVGALSIIEQAVGG